MLDASACAYRLVEQTLLLAHLAKVLALDEQRLARHSPLLCHVAVLLQHALPLLRYVSVYVCVCVFYVMATPCLFEYIEKKNGYMTHMPNGLCSPPPFTSYSALRVYWPHSLPNALLLFCFEYLCE